MLQMRVDHCRCCIPKTRHKVGVSCSLLSGNSSCKRKTLEFKIMKDRRDPVYYRIVNQKVKVCGESALMLGSLPTMKGVCYIIQLWAVYATVHATQVV